MIRFEFWIKVVELTRPFSGPDSPFTYFLLRRVASAIHDAGMNDEALEALKEQQ